MARISNPMWTVVILAWTACTHMACAASSSITWRQITPLPDPRGYAGMFAGVAGGKLIVAGGANFPDTMPWEGGKKVWYDTVFVLDRSDGQWRIAGKLPRPL